MTQRSEHSLVCLPRTHSLSHCRTPSLTPISGHSLCCLLSREQLFLHIYCILCTAQVSIGAHGLSMDGGEWRRPSTMLIAQTLYQNTSTDRMQNACDNIEKIMARTQPAPIAQPHCPTTLLHLPLSTSLSLSLPLSRNAVGPGPFPTISGATPFLGHDANKQRVGCPAHIADEALP